MIINVQMTNEVPMSRPFFSQVRLGGGIPVASQAKVTGLLMVSTTLSSAGPSILGGTEKKKFFVTIVSQASFINTISLIFFHS